MTHLRLHVVPYSQCTTSSMIELVSHYCSPMERDGGSCPCSEGGCLPLHKFNNGVFVQFVEDSYQVYWAPKYWSSLSETIMSWTRACRLDDKQITECFRDTCRLEVFTRLGMAHTCCVFDYPDPSVTSGFPERIERDATTCLELQDEDVELKEQLEAIMEAYEKTLNAHQGSIEEFWKWWWAILQGLLPEIPPWERRRTPGDRGAERYADASHLPPHDEIWHYAQLLYGNSAIPKIPDTEFSEQTNMDFLDQIKRYFAVLLTGNPPTRLLR